MDSNTYQSLEEAYQSMYSSQEDVENLDENITGGSVMARLAGHGRGNVFKANLHGKSGSVDVDVNRTQQAGGLTDKSDKQMQNWKFDKPLQLDTKSAKTKTEVQVKPNLSFGSAPKPKPDPTNNQNTSTVKPKPKPKPTDLKTSAPKPKDPRSGKTEPSGRASALGGPITIQKPDPGRTAFAQEFPKRTETKFQDPRGRVNSSYEMDTYNLVLEYLLDEGFASTEQSADKIILNMSESWFESILEEVGLGK